MKILRLLLLPLLFMFFSITVLLPNAYSESFKDIYYKFDGWAANFDPMGRALAPLNNIPELKVNGLLYQWSFINVHSDEKVQNVEKDWRFQQVQFLAEIHTRYQLAPKTALAAKFHYHYDGIYDWQKSSLFADDVNPNAERTNSWDQFFREFNLDMELGNWYMKFGKQQVVWGKMEGRWMDFINNLDRKDGLQIRSFYYTELRIPLWMSNVTYIFGKNSVQFLWIPDYEPDLNPYPGSPWFSPLSTDPRNNPLFRGAAEEPGISFNDHQWAIRYDTKFDQVTWTIGYMYGFAPSAVNFIKLDQSAQPFYAPEYTRRHYFGTALDFAHKFNDVPVVKRLPLVFRTEWVYKTNFYFIDPKKWDSENRILISGNGLTDTDQLSGAVQFKFFLPSRITFTYQPMFSYYYGWKRSLGINHWRLGHLFLVNKTFESFEDRLSATLYTFLNTGGPVNEWQGSKTQLVLSYNFSDYIQGKLHYVDYRGGERDTYGKYDLWDNAGWELVYRF